VLPWHAAKVGTAKNPFGRGPFELLVRAGHPSGGQEMAGNFSKSFSGAF